MPKLLAECLTLTWTDLAQELAGSKVALVPLALGNVPLLDLLHTASLPAVRIVLPADLGGRSLAQGPALPGPATWSLPADGQEGAVPTYRLTSTQCLTLPDTWEFIYHELLSTTDAFFIICLNKRVACRDIIEYADQVWAACGSMLPVGCRRGLWYAGPTKVPPRFLSARGRAPVHADSFEGAPPAAVGDDWCPAYARNSQLLRRVHLALD